MDTRPFLLPGTLDSTAPRSLYSLEFCVRRVTLSFLSYCRVQREKTEKQASDFIDVVRRQNKERKDNDYSRQRSECIPLLRPCALARIVDSATTV